MVRGLFQIAQGRP